MQMEEENEKWCVYHWPPVIVGSNTIDDDDLGKEPSLLSTTTAGVTSRDPVSKSSFDANQGSLIAQLPAQYIGYYIAEGPKR